MKLLIAFMFALPGLASADPTLGYVALLSDSSFSICAAQASVEQVISKTPLFLGYTLHYVNISSIENTAQSIKLRADLNFFAGPPGTTNADYFSVVVTSLDVINGWQLIQSAPGQVRPPEDYPFSASAESTGTVVQQSGGSPIFLGGVDLSACVIYTMPPYVGNAL